MANKNTKNIVLVVILLACIGYMFGGVLFKQKKATPAAQESVPKFNKQELSDLIVENDVKPASHRQWGKRNPFNTSAIETTTAAATIFNLGGIFLGSDTPSAIINNNVVGIGEKIGGLTVTDIKEQGVKLVDDQGRETFLTLKTTITVIDENVAIQAPAVEKQPAKLKKTRKH